MWSHWKPSAWAEELGHIECAKRVASAIFDGRHLQTAAHSQKDRQFLLEHVLGVWGSHIPSGHRQVQAVFYGILECHDVLCQCTHP